MKSVLISIQPKWCELIASSKKTIEIRKSRPKIETPVKCYIYCTKSKKPYESFAVSGKPFECGGKVIGEFMCDNIVDCRDINMDSTCLTVPEWLKYTKGHKGNVWGWHISDLVIYDKPKELSEFRSYNVGTYLENGYPMPTHEIKRPPQSWCYVEEQ